ncbi:hypothetical protein CLOP_g3661 [Closterium sp. NIES-67]|nr:hypothetical protein CLOP_g3661 [Closterium sp. NIES-67]
MDALSRPPAAPLPARRWVVPHKKWALPSASPLPASASYGSSLADSSLLSSHVPSHPSHVSSHPSHGGSWANGSVVEGSCGADPSQRGRERAAQGWANARSSGGWQGGDAAVPGGAPADAGWRKRKSHLSAAADDSACLTSSHGADVPPSALPHPSHAPSHADSPFAHPAASPRPPATRWDVPLFSAKRACLAADQRRPAEAPWAERPAEGAAWAERPAAWVEGAQGREAAAAAAAPFQPTTGSAGRGALLAFAVGAAPSPHGDGRGSLHHPASSARSIGASLESGARTRRGVCARGRKRRGAEGDLAQQGSMAGRAGDGGAGIEAGGRAGWDVAQGEGEQSSCANGGTRGDDDEEGGRGEEEAERREGGGAESVARPRRRRRKGGLLGVAEEGEEGEGATDYQASASPLASLAEPSAPGVSAAVGDAARLDPSSHVPDGRAGSAYLEATRSTGGTVASASANGSSADCYSTRGSSAGERDSTAREHQQQQGRRQKGRPLHELANGAGGEGTREAEREADSSADDWGGKRQRQRQRAVEEERGAQAQAEERAEVEMKRRFSVVVQSQVGGEGDEEAPQHEGEADRCMSEHVGAAKFVLSSGRTLSAECLPAAKKKPTIDDEFEQYFAQLLL